MAEPAVLCVFDLLAVRGRDVRHESLLTRKEPLKELLPSVAGLYLVPYLQTHGEALFQTAVDHCQEGIVGKRTDSVYRAGVRPEWRKVKNGDFYRKEALGFR